MRKYKNLFIPDRHLRTADDILEKQNGYCMKSNCAPPNGKVTDCTLCLFERDNIKEFQEWYLAKKKKC